MNDLDLRKGEYPIILSPNLGQPVIINIKDHKKEDAQYYKKVVFNAYVIAIPKQTPQEILEFFHLNIFIQPILNEEGDFLSRRGKRYPLQIIGIEKLKRIDIENPDILNEDNLVAWDIFNSALQIRNIFGKRKNIYKINFQVKKIKILEEILTETGRNCLLFDIVHDLPNRIIDKVNYHAVALFDKDWQDFKFIHATDFHIARRNDYIAKGLKKRLEKKILKSKKILESEKDYLGRKFKFKEEIQEDRIEDLRIAKYNFNHNLRMLIKYSNKQNRYEELDFILMTGDLIDYIQIARGNNLYKNNYQVFHDILLGKNRDLDKNPYLDAEEYLNIKEILTPIFTTTGNHDYRKGHYSIRIGGANKIFGMTKRDVRTYTDVKLYNYPKALYSRNKFLREYYRYINPNLNYKIKIGNKYNFIFLDTGQDSIADLHDLLKGSPSCKGLKDHQISLLRSYIQLCQDQKIVIVMHAPPISPSLNYLKQRKFKKAFHIERELEWSDFYEDNIKKFTGDGRLEKFLNLKYQTIMYNWKNFLKICTGSDDIIRRKVDIVLCGHTHTLKEFRLKEVKSEEAENINMGFYIAPIYIDIPCKIFSSNYRKKLEEFYDAKELEVWFDVNKPFVFQTQAIGPLSLHQKFKPPGFRYLTIKNNQIISIRVFSLHIVK